MNGFPARKSRGRMSPLLGCLPVGVPVSAEGPRESPAVTCTLGSEMVLPAECASSKNPPRVGDLLVPVLSRHTGQGAHRAPTVVCPHGSEGSRSGCQRAAQ